MARQTQPPEDPTRVPRNQILLEGFKGLVLLNGGVAAAMGAFLQAIWDKQNTGVMRAYLLYGIGVLLLGAASASILFYVRYRTFFDNSNLRLNKWWRRMNWLIVLSLSCFIIGMGLAVIGGLKSL